MPFFPVRFLLPMWYFLIMGDYHPRRPRGSQSGREKRREETFQVRAKEPLGTDSHRTISKNSNGCRLLIGRKKCFVLLCPIGEQFLPTSFREFVHDCYCLATLARFVHQACACNHRQPKRTMCRSRLQRSFGRNILELLVHYLMPKKCKKLKDMKSSCLSICTSSL